MRKMNILMKKVKNKKRNIKKNINIIKMATGVEVKANKKVSFKPKENTKMMMKLRKLREKSHLIILESNIIKIL